MAYQALAWSGVHFSRAWAAVALLDTGFVVQDTSVDLYPRFGNSLLDVIVLGGGMSKTKHLYEAVPKLWGAWIFSDRVDTRLLRNVHGDSSGVRGAARLWPA